MNLTEKQFETLTIVNNLCEGMDNSDIETISMTDDGHMRRAVGRVLSKLERMGLITTTLRPKIGETRPVKQYDITPLGASVIATTTN